MFMRNLLMASEIEAKAARYTRAMKMYVDHSMVVDLRRKLLAAEATESKLDVVLPKACETILTTAEKTTGRRASGIKAEKEAKEAADNKADQTPIPKTKFEIVKESTLYNTIRMVMNKKVFSSDETWNRIASYLEFYATTDSDAKILANIATLMARGDSLSNIRP